MNTPKTTRRKRTAVLAIALCAAVFAGFLAGCNPAAPGGKDETTALPPAEDTGLTINLYQPDPAQAALWQTLAADYKTLTGVGVDVRSPEGTAPTTELKAALEGESGAPGIFVFTNPREYRAWQDYAVDISDTQAYQHLIDPRLALAADGKIIGLPLGVDAFGVIYNKKILDKYFSLESKHTEFESIADIQDAQDLNDLAADMQELKDDLNIDGAFAAPALKEGESAAWTTRLFSLPLGYEIAQRKTEVTAEKLDDLSLRYTGGYKGFFDVVRKNATVSTKLEERTYEDAATEFATGKAAMILGGTDFLGRLNSAVGQTVSADDIAFMPAFLDLDDVPKQGLAFEATAYTAINGKLSEENRKAAAEFLNWLYTSEKGMDFLANQLNVLAPYDTETDATLPNNTLSADAFEWLNSDAGTNVVTYSALTPGEEFRDKVLGSGLLAYHKGESVWSDFKENVRKGWDDLRDSMDKAFK